MLITVDVLVGDTMVLVPGLDACGVHTPGPDTALIVVMPGIQKLTSTPASGLTVTLTLIVSVHPLTVHT